MSGDEKPSDIRILTQRIPREDLRRMVEGGFGDMVKFVADVDRGVIAIGGQLHADAEALLIDSGSRSGNLWGANYYPGRGRDACIEYVSLINIRPAQDNPSSEIKIPEVREKVRELTYRLIGEGEEL